MIFLIDSFNFIISYLINTDFIKLIFLRIKFRSDVYYAVRYYYRRACITFINEDPDLWGVEIYNSKVKFLENFDIFFLFPDPKFTGTLNFNFSELMYATSNPMYSNLDCEVFGLAVTLYALERAYEDNSLFAKHVLADQIKALNYYVELREDKEIVLFIKDRIEVYNFDETLDDEIVSADIDLRS